MRDINKDVEYVRDLLSVLYEVPTISEIIISPKMCKTHGMCTTHKNDNGWTKLTFAKFILDERYPYNDYLSIIAHELIHAIDRNKTKELNGHGGNWARMAQEVSDCYGFLTIQRYCTSEQTAFAREIKPKKIYQCKCEKCGYVYTRKGYRAPKWYMRPHDYTHTGCGGHLQRV